MAHCINIKNSEYKKLAKESSLGQRELKARIATWQELNHTDSFPSIEQVEGLLESNIPVKIQEEFNENSFLMEHYPNIDNTSLKDSVNNIRSNDPTTSFNSLKVQLDNIHNGVGDRLDSFMSVINKLCIEDEKKELLKNNNKQEAPTFKELLNQYDDYLDYPKDYVKFNPITQKVFDRIYDFNRAIESDYPTLKSYTIQSSNSYINKYKNDLREYNALNNKGSQTFYHKDPNSEVPDRNTLGRINHAISTLKRNLSDKAEINTTVKKSDKGYYTVVYFNKPTLNKYNPSYHKAEVNTEQEIKDKVLEGVFEGKQNISTKEALVRIAQTFPVMKDLCNTLRGYVTEDSTLNHNDVDYLDEQGHDGTYNPEDNSITISNNGMSPEVIFHEVMHGLVDKYIDSNPNSEIVKDIQDLMDHVKSQIGDKYNAFTNPKEFASQFFSNKDFAKELTSIQGIKSLKGKYDNIFKQLMNKLLEIFGIKPKESAYKQAFETISNVINKQYQTTQSTKELQVSNSYNKALRAVSNIYSPVEINELTDTIAQEFSWLVSWYKEDYPELDRWGIIKQVTPTQLFDELKQYFEEDLKEYTDKKSPYTDNMQKFLDNYSNLAMVATSKINSREGLKFYTNDLEAFNYKTSGDEQMTDMVEEDQSHENTNKEGWMDNYRFTSVGESLTNKLKVALSDIDMLTNKKNSKGEFVPYLNSIGYAKKMSLDVVKNDILRSTQSMVSSKDMFKALGVLASEKRWIKPLIDQLQQDNELASQFYHALKKDFRPLRAMKSSLNNNGLVTYNSFSINESNDYNLILNDWKSYLSNKLIHDANTSIYSKDGSLNKKNIDKNLIKLNELSKVWDNIIRRKDVNERITFAINKDNINTIKTLLNSIGVGVTKEDVQNIMEDALVDTAELKSVFGMEVSSFNLDTILDTLKKQYEWSLKNLNKNNTELYNNNIRNYKTLAIIVSNSTDQYQESSVHENGKSRYSYVQPSYVSKMIKQLKNVWGTKKDFEAYIQDNYKQYTGTIYDPATKEYNISWLNELTDPNTGAEARKKLAFSETVHFNKTEYSNLSDRDYQLMLMVDYFSNENTAWYHIPVLAEAQSAESIRFTKYTDNFKEQVSQQLLKVFNYEWKRIQIVKDRQKSIKEEVFKAIDEDKFVSPEAKRYFIEDLKGDRNKLLKDIMKGSVLVDTTIKPIKNFDTLGSSYQFLKFLNQHSDKIDALKEQANRGDISKSALEQGIKGLIIQELDKKADQAIKDCKSWGVLEKSENNKEYKYLKALNITEDNLQNMMHEYYYNSYLATTNIVQLITTDIANYKDIADFYKRNKQGHAPGNMLNTQAMYNGERIGKDKETFVVLSDQIKPSTDEVMGHIKSILDANPYLSDRDKANYLSKFTENNVSDAAAYRSLKSAREIIAMTTGWNDALEGTYQRLMNNTWSPQDYETFFQAFKPYVFTQYAVDSKIQIDPKSKTGETYKLKIPTQHKNAEVVLLPMMPKQLNSPKLEGMLKAMDNHGIDVIMFESAVKDGLQGAININEFESSKQVNDFIGSFRNDSQVFKQIPYEDYKIQNPVPEHLMDAEALVGTQGRKNILADLEDTSKFQVNGKILKGSELKNLFHNLVIDNLMDDWEDLSSKFNNIDDLKDLINEELIYNDRYAKDLLNACEVVDGKFVLPLFDPTQSNRVQQLLNSIWKSRITKQKMKGGQVVNMSSFGVSDHLNLKFKIKDGKPSIDYMECYIPFPSNVPEEFFSKYMTNGVYSIDKLLEDKLIDNAMLEAIGYRIPTEDKYSIWPMKIKGFLPRNSGSNIILPREITTITGLDFDVDKMYLMLKEVNFDKTNGTFRTILPDTTSEQTGSKELQRQKRNNLIVDLYRSVLNHPDTASKQILPGNFDELKRVSRVLDVLASGSDISLEKLNSLSLDELDKIVNRNPLDPLDFSTQVKIRKQNMAAAALIGIIANHTSNHYVRQGTNINLNPIVTKEGILNRFTINGHFYTNLHGSVKPDNSGFISKSYGCTLAASVDAIKDPVLNALNYNTTTADAGLTLTGLGYNEDEIGFFLRQPAIEEFVDSFEKAERGTSKNEILETILNKYKDLSQTFGNYVANSSTTEMLATQNTIEELANNIRFNGKIRNAKTSDNIEEFGANKPEFQKYYQSQYRVLLHFKNLMEASQKVADFVSATKADTTNGGAGPTIADTNYKLRAITKHIDNCLKENPILENANVIMPSDKFDFENSSKLKEQIKASPLKSIQGFITLGLQANSKALSKWFPQFGKDFTYIQNILENSYLKSGKLSVDMTKKLYDDYFTYFMSQSPEFSRENANTYIKNFPKRYKGWLQEHPDLQNLTLFKNIHYSEPTNTTPLPTLVYKSGGGINTGLRDIVMQEWESLLYNPKYKDLAIDLFKYNYYLSGFGFNANSFMHMVPTAVKVATLGYTNNLYSTLNSQMNDITLNTFIDQFVRNHLNNQKLVPQVNSLKDNIFKDDNKILEDIVTPVSYVSNPELFNNNRELLPFVSRIIDGEKTFYRVINITPEGSEKITINLHKVTPLNNEYEFNNPDIQTIWPTEAFTDENENIESANPNMPQETYDYESDPELFEVPEDINNINQEAFETLGTVYNEFIPNTYNEEQLSDLDYIQDRNREAILNSMRDEIDESKNKCK